MEQLLSRILPRYADVWAMMNSDSKEAMVTGTKIVGVWGLLGAYSISEFASLMAAFASGAAAILTTLFIDEFLWKKLIRPFCEDMGWVAPKRDRRRLDRRFGRFNRRAEREMQDSGAGDLSD